MGTLGSPEGHVQAWPSEGTQEKIIQCLESLWERRGPTDAQGEAEIRGTRPQPGSTGGWKRQGESFPRASAESVALPTLDLGLRPPDCVRINLCCFELPGL